MELDDGHHQRRRRDRPLPDLCLPRDRRSGLARARVPGREPAHRARPPGERRAEVGHGPGLPAAHAELLPRHRRHRLLPGRALRETKRREFLDAALAGAKYLLSVAKTEGESCLIFHDEPDNKDLYYLGWCHGPVGTARLFFLLSEVTGDKAWLDWVRKSANGLLQSGIPEQETPGFWNNAGICCGLAGVGEFFLDLYLALGDHGLPGLSPSASPPVSWPRRPSRTGRCPGSRPSTGPGPTIFSPRPATCRAPPGIGTFLLRLAAVDRAKTRRIVFPDTPFVR